MAYGKGGRMMSHKSFGSTASLGTRKGAGPVAGAGELVNPGAGPGRAAQKKIGMVKEGYPSRGVASGSAPKGMRTYREE